MIEIMKASAGSGKTFNLAKNYIHILLQKKDLPDAYRHILAVTFTNKATDEMKTRILKELYILSTEPSLSDFRKFFVPGKESMDEEAVCKDDKELQNAASVCLNNILHDYTSFAVSTIDKFFQKALKSFVREIGHFASYQIELDRDSMIRESVERVLDSITEDNHKLLDWLTKGAMNEIAEGRKYKMERSLFETAKRLKHFSHIELVENLGINEAEAYSKEHIEEIESLCRKVSEDFASSVREVSGRVIKEIEGRGYGTEDFRRYFYSGISALTNFRKGDALSLSKTVLDCLSGEKELFTASDKAAAAKKNELLPVLEKDFQALLAFFGKPVEEYMTSLSILSNLHDLGLAAELYREFDALSKEKNIMSLVESDNILKGIINGSDTPFIYEKLGVRLENFLLDEFQDTSSIQWENMWPLLRDSQSHESYYSGREDVEPYSLIVGDVKQSIYRWRGSDWGLLAKDVEREFRKADIEVKNTELEDNYRSLGAIVDFNNGFFPFAAKKLDEKLAADENMISGIYASTAQNCKSSEKARGSVDLTFAPEDMQKDIVLEAINEVLERGGSYKDIAILVRTNRLGAEIAEFLISKGVPVVTNDSLLVRSSSVVRRVAAGLALLDNPEDPIASYISGWKGTDLPEDCRSISEECGFFLRKIEEETPGSLAAHTLYIQSFMDIIQNYVVKNGNNLRGFLQDWAENNDSIFSPGGGQAVNIITIHKAKGLEFPYVIYFYRSNAQEMSIRWNEKFWCRPDSEGSALESLSDEIFDVRLSKSSEATMFRKDYREELKRLYVDLINVAYVAFTRPSKGLHIVTSPPKGDSLATFLHEYALADGSGFKSLDETSEDVIRLRLGELYDFAAASREDEKKKPVFFAKERGVYSPFVSFEPNPLLNSEDEGKRRLNRLRLDTEAADFFSDEGKTGVEASMRLKGNILHSILASVEDASDLPSSVEDAVLSGDLTEEQGREALDFLSRAIDSVNGRFWFSDGASMIRNEVSIVDADGQVYRPDRVVGSGGRLQIIDYKFGEPMQRYKKQLKKYASLYKALGYNEVEAYIWYVGKAENAVVRVE